MDGCREVNTPLASASWFIKKKENAHVSGGNRAENLLFVLLLLLFLALFLIRTVLQHLLVEGLARSLASLLGRFVGSGLSLALVGISDLGTTHGQRVRVKLGHDTLVLERILLELVAADLHLCGVDDGLDLVGVNHASDVTTAHAVTGKLESGLELGGARVGSEKLVELVESRLHPDAEASDVTTRSKLKEVKAVDVNQFDSGEVLEGTLHSLGLVGVHDKGSTAHGVATVTHLSLSTTDIARLLRLDDVSGGSESLESLHGLLRLVDGGELVADDERNLGNVVDLVSAGHHKRRDSGSGERRSNGVSALVHVDLLVPSAPGLGGSEHTSSSAHVTEGGLSGAVGTTSSDTRNTRDGTSSTPGLRGGLVTGHEGHSVCLAFVLVHLRVNELNDVKTNGSREDDRKLGRRGSLGSIIGVQHGDERSGSCVMLRTNDKIEVNIHMRH